MARTATPDATPHVHDASCAIHGHNRLGRRPAMAAPSTLQPQRLGAAGLGAPRLAYGGFSASNASSDAATALACDCGHAHIPDPATLSAPLTLRSGLAAVLAVGIRPCSGAIIVLVFALSQQLWWAGILSVLAMSLGTGLTVAALATLAVKAKDIAVRFTGNGSPSAARALRAFELAAAAGIFLFGLAMLGGALAGA